MGSGPPEISQNIEFLSNTGQNPLKNHKAAKPAFKFGLQRHDSKKPFECRFAGGPIMVRY